MRSLRNIHKKENKNQEKKQKEKEEVTEQSAAFLVFYFSSFIFGGINLAKYEITHDRAKCIGCGACASVCPDNWIMKPDGKSAPKKKELDDLGCNMKAAKGCPVNVIHITEKSTGKKLV